MDKDLSGFAGENKTSNLILGRESLVTVDVFRRVNKTYYFRVSIRSVVKPNLISRYQLDLDRYTDEASFLRAVAIAGGAIAERQCDMYGDRHDPDDCARAAMEAAKEILHSGKVTPG